MNIRGVASTKDSLTKPDAAECTAVYRRIIRAAEEAFKRSGFRGVTMEAVAREAAVAKATLYAQFRNKEEVFLAVCSRMALHNTRVFIEALTDVRRPLDERVREAIIAKQRRVLTLVRTSPYAEDLFSHKALLAGDIFAEQDESMMDHLAEALRTDARLRPRARQVARALFLGGSGLAAQITTVDELEAELGSFVNTFLAGARSRAAHRHRTHGLTAAS